MDDENNFSDKSCSVVLVLRSLGAGGVEVHACQLAAGLLKRGFDLTIISLCEGEVNDNFRQLGVRIIQLADSSGQSLNSLRNISALCGTFRQMKPDIVHLHGIRPIFIGSLAARLVRIPKIISTMHGSYRLMTMDSHGHSSPVKLAASVLMHSIGVLFSSHFLTVAKVLEAEAQYCLKRTVGSWLTVRYSRKISVVRNGIDDKFFNAPVLKRPETKIPTIGTVARLDPKKGIPFLLEAVTNLNKNGTECRLVIVGNGPFIAEYKNFVCAANLDVNIIFAGHQEDVIPLLQEMDIFVLPSLSEGMPLVILEAMAIGVPVIATNVGGIPEIVKNEVTGLLIPPASTRDLTEALHRLLTNTNLRASFTNAAFKYVNTNHREGNMIELVIEKYES